MNETARLSFPDPSWENRWKKEEWGIVPKGDDEIQDPHT